MDKIIIKPFLYLIFLASIAHAETSRYAVDELVNNPDLYLSNIIRIDLSSNNRIVIEGERNKDKFITGRLLESVLSNINLNVSSPECYIAHTDEESNAYDSFQNAFKRRSFGLDGGLLVMKWQRDKFNQKVCFKNIDKNTAFASSLLKSDILLKRIVMGDKNSKVFRIPSFVMFVESEMLNKLEDNEFVAGTGYESIFYLLPDTIQLSIAENSIYTINDLKFKLVPYRQHSGEASRKIEIEWANIFNGNCAKLFKKHGELRQLAEIFKFYLIVKSYAAKGCVSKYVTNDFPAETPEKINSIKFSRCLEAPAPLINEPGRIKFIWILISGGISFYLTDMVIISSVR